VFVRGMGGNTLRGKLTRQGLEGGILIRLDDSERGYAGRFRPLASSEDGSTWALNQPNTSSVVLWDTSTNRELGPALRGHAAMMYAAAFSGDGRLLATADMNEEIWLWDLDPSAWAERACAIADRNLSWDEWQQSFPDRPYRKTCEGLPVPYSVVRGAFRSAHRASPGGESLSTSVPAEAAMAWAEEIGSSEVFNQLCWEQSLAGMARSALPLCERAVALAPSRADFRDSRGLARALTGDYHGAIDDFTFFVKWKKQDSDWISPMLWKQRQDWISRLKTGDNPFDSSTLAELASIAAFSPAE
jgi:hypothetical protein